MGSISDKISYLEQTKREIADAIVEKGQTVVYESDSFRSYANKIKEINSGGSGGVDLIGDISGFTNEQYSTLGAYLQYCVDNGYLPDMNNLPLIPYASNNVMPSGKVIYSYYSGNSFPANGYGTDGLQYYAFDGREDTCACINRENVTGAWIGYEFNSPKTVKRVKIKAGNYLASNSFTVKYQYYAEATDSWVDVGDPITVTGYDNGSYGEFDINLEAPVKATKHRLYVVETKVSGTNVMIVMFQLFGN